MEGDEVVFDLERMAESDRETAYLLSSPTNRQRLLDALGRDESISFEAVLEMLHLQDEA
jgi:PHD/YefM family antitoxin component YafN of YafNO toxin-antitoxin module